MPHRTENISKPLDILATQKKLLDIKDLTLTVIIQNYNQAEFLDKAILNVLHQSRQPDEFIIVDDYSTDKSMEIIEKYRAKYLIRVISNNQNMGAIASANKALNEVNSTYFFILGADDLIMPGFFEKSMILLEAYPQAALCCSHAAFLNSTTNEIDTHDQWYKYSKKPVFVSAEQALSVVSSHKIWIAGHTAICRKDALYECGNFLPQLKWHTDWFALHVMAFRYGFCYIPEPLCALRIAPNSFSCGAKNPMNQAEVLFQMTQFIKDPKFQDVRSAFETANALDSFQDYQEYMIQEFQPWRRWTHNINQNLRIQALEDNLKELNKCTQRLSELVTDTKKNLRAYNIFKKLLSFLKPVYHFVLNFYLISKNSKFSRSSKFKNSN